MWNLRRRTHWAVAAERSCHPAALICAALALLAVSLSANQIGAPGSASNAGDTLARGRALLQRLTLHPDSDAAVFAALPANEPETLLMAVVTAGQGYRSDPTLWPAMHRALSALVEVAVYRRQESKAAAWESFQATLYQNYDLDYAQALAASERALVLAEKFVPPAQQVSYVSNVGLALYRLGRIDDARTYLARARDAAPATFDLVMATTRRTIVNADLLEENLDAASAEVAAFRTAAANPGTPAVFRAYVDLAASDVQMEKGDYGGMLRSVHDALTVAGSDRDTEIVRYACVVQVLEGVIAASSSLSYDEALALAKRIGSEFPSLPVPVEPFAEATIRRRRRAAGDLDAMLRADNAALADARTRRDAGAVAEALLAESLDYTSMNAARQAIGLLDEASTLLAGELAHATYPGGEGLAHLRISVLTNLGLSYGDAGELERAHEAWNEIPRVIDAVPAGMARQQLEPGRALALVGNASVAELEDDPGTAAALLRQALPLVQAKSGPTRSEILNDLARVEALSGKEADEVSALYEQAIAAAANERDVDFQTTIQLAFAKFLADGPGHGLPDAAARAERELTAAQESAQRLHLANAQWKVEYGFGLLEETAGRVDKALARYQRAAGMVEALRSGLTLDENRQSFVDNKAVQALYDRLVNLSMRQGQPQRAWEYLERDKARSFSEMLRGRTFVSADDRSGRTSQLTDMEHRILRMKLELSPDNAALLRGSGREPGALAAELERLTSEYEVARQASRLESGASRRVDALAPLAEVQKHLSPGTALIEYGLLPDAVAVFVMTRSATAAELTPVEGAHLRRDLLKLRRALASPSTASEANALIVRVSPSLISPLGRHLDGIHRLIVVPAGAMNYVPFGVLRTADGRQIVDSYDVSTLPSASSVPLLHPTRIAGQPVFVGALGAVPVLGWPPLPGTLREAQDIARVFPRATLAAEKAFTRSRVLAALQQEGVVHLATHGDLDDAAPLFSAVITAPSAGGPPRISLYELSNIRVRSELVVLSACETATGKLLGGDEVTGLTRTLLLAGANAVVSTLWNVDDAVTADLVRSFYTELRRGRTVAESLRTAELTIRKTHPEPAYWAPFVASAVQ